MAGVPQCVISGRKLDDTDEAAKRPVCCIGQTAARELFGSVNPVGEEITVKSARFQVVGLLDFKGQANVVLVFFGSLKDDATEAWFATHFHPLAGEAFSRISTHE